MKKITLFTIAVLCMLKSYAQESTNTGSQSDQYVVSPIGENWNISIGVGAEFHPHLKLIDNLSLDVPTSFQFDVSVTKWLNPYVGLRIKSAYSTFDVTSTPTMNLFVQDGETSASGSIISLHGDAMFDFTSIFGGYNENRFYSVKPYVGIGFASVGASGERANEYTPTVGILNEFKISKPLSLHLDLGLIAPNAGIYGECVGNPRFFTTSVTIGATFFFGREKAREFKTLSMSDDYRAMLIENESLNKDLLELKNTNSTLARDKSALQKELEALRVQKAKTPNKNITTQVEIAPVAMFFGIDKSNVTKEDIARLKFVAAIMKEQPDVKFVIEGYADSATGSTHYNEKLSQKRADAICDVLINKYGVDASQLQSVGMGGTDGLFDDMTLNRAVITRTTTK